MAEAIIPIDKEGRPLFSAIAWYEGVAKDEAAFLESRLGADHIFSICGLPIDAAFPLPKMMWMRSHHPEVYERSWKWLQMADYVYYKLCGATATDYTIACRTLAYDLHARSWSKEMLDTASAARSKRDQRLAFQLRQVVIQPRINDPRTDAPPDRKTHIDGIVGHDIGTLLNRRPRFGVVHLHGRTRLTVAPIQVGSRILLRRLDLPEACTLLFGQSFRSGFGHSRSRKIGH